MQGRILVWEPDKRAGIIIGEDGIHYMFLSDSLSPSAVIVKGTHVNFVAERGVARGVVVRPEPEVKVRPAAGATPTQAPRTASYAQSLEEEPERITLWGGFTKSMQLSFSGEGRASRTEYWGKWLFSLLFVASAKLIDVVYVYMGHHAIWEGIVALIILPAGIAVTIRRFHDLGDSGWSWFLLLVPLYNIWVWFKIAAEPSEPTTNKYGPPASLSN